MIAKWTEEETNYLILLVGLKYTRGEIEKRLPHRTKGAIHGKLKRLRLNTSRVSLIGINEGMKRCSNKECQNNFKGGDLGVLPATKEFFHSNSGRRKSGAKKSTDGLYPRCKKCKNSTRSQNYLNNIERELAYQKDYNSKNSLRVESSRREYYMRHREAILKKKAEYRAIPENRARARLNTRKWYSIPANRAKRQRDENQKYEKKKLEEQAKLIEYFQKNAPDQFWKEKDNLSEKDLQMYIVHELINKYNLEVYWEVRLDKGCIPDIYIPTMDLLLEVKATKRIWTKKQIIEQVKRYEKIEECWLVCLDKKPLWASENFIHWTTPKDLFNFLDVEILGKPLPF